MMNDEHRDLASALAGDDDAFARLYDRHAGVVLSLCQWRVYSHAEAEDAMQETFIRAHRRLGDVENADKLRPWLFGIASRVCKERIRSATRRRRHEDGAMTRAALYTTPLRGPSEDATHDEQHDRLTAALDVLSDDERLAVHLYYLDADPVRAGASALGVSRSGFYKLLNRARRRLADHMKEAQSA